MTQPTVSALKEVVVLRSGFSPTRSTSPCYNTTYACNIQSDTKQVVKEIWHNAASLLHVDGSVVFFRWRQCTQYIESQKWLPWQHPLEARNRKVMAESNGSLPPGGWLMITCGLTACTLWSALGPMLCVEYGKPWPFL